MNRVVTRRACSATSPSGLSFGLTLSFMLMTAATVAAQGHSLAISRQATDNQQAIQLPGPLKEVGIDQRLGDSVPLDLEFVDEEGATVRLGDLVAQRPVLLVPAYYECQMLCSLVLDGVVRGLRPLQLDPGRDIEVVVVSFDPRETPESALRMRKATLDLFNRPAADGGWHFLTGEPASIDALLDSIGYRAVFDEESQQYAHAGGIVVLTPEGQISRYFFGVDFEPKQLRLSLVDASEGSIGSLIDQVFLFCFQYDPKLGRYSAVILNIMQLAGVVTVVALAAFLLIMWRRERRIPANA